MNEFELKLSLPDEKFSALEKLVISKGGIRRQHLQAFYLDTDDFHLAEAGVALRLRKEGRRWVQTLKASKNNSLERLEHNVFLTNVGSAIPKWNIDLHDGHPAHQVLIKVLEKAKLAASNLSVRYQTDIWRRPALVKVRGALLEYALDTGFVKSYSRYGHEKTILISELEIELKAGDDCALVKHAEMLVKRYGLFIDTRSKAQRGFLAANGLDHAKAVRAKETHIKGESDSAISSALIYSCLNQILPNASEINAGIDYFDDHLHQLRVGLRRLKTAMKSLRLIQVFFTENHLQS